MPDAINALDLSTEDFKKQIEAICDADFRRRLHAPYMATPTNAETSASPPAADPGTTSNPLAPPPAAQNKPVNALELSPADYAKELAKLTKPAAYRPSFAVWRG